MRIGLISDIHGNAPALKALLSALVKEGVDKILFLGDLVGYYPFVGECLDLLGEYDLQGVRGNHDQVAIDCLDSGRESSSAYSEAYGTALDRTLSEGDPRVEEFLRELPLSLEFRTGERVFHLYHGSPWDPLEGRVYPDFGNWELFSSLKGDLCLLGHTHYPMSRSVGELQIANPGSVGQPRHRSGVACGAVLDAASPSPAIKFLEVAYDPAEIIADARRHNPHLAYVSEVLAR